MSFKKYISKITERRKIKERRIITKGLNVMVMVKSQFCCEVSTCCLQIRFGQNMNFSAIQMQMFVFFIFMRKFQVNQCSNNYSCDSISNNSKSMVKFNINSAMKRKVKFTNRSSHPFFFNQFAAIFQSLFQLSKADAINVIFGCMPYISTWNSSLNLNIAISHHICAKKPSKSVVV